MTIVRRHGIDTPFSGWVRSCNKLDSVQFSITLNDVDCLVYGGEWLVHKYKYGHTFPTRGLSCMMKIEVKTNGAEPSQIQQESVFLDHQSIDKGRFIERLKPNGSMTKLWHFGWFVLRFSGWCPRDSKFIHWGRFNDLGEIYYKRITKKKLIEILRFDRRPDTLEKERLIS